MAIINEVKLVKSISGSSFDNLLSNIITSVKKLLEGNLNIGIISASVSEYSKKNVDGTIILKKVPSSITAITFQSDKDTEEGVTEDLFSTDGGRIITLSDTNASYPLRYPDRIQHNTYPRYKIEYDIGYETEDDIPLDLRMAIVRIASIEFDQISGKEIVAEEALSRKIQYSNTAKEKQSILESLSHYRVVIME